MGYPLKKILASLPPGPRPTHFHRRGGAPATESHYADYNRIIVAYRPSYDDNGAVCITATLKRCSSPRLIMLAATSLHIPHIRTGTWSGWRQRRPTTPEGTEPSSHILVCRARPIKDATNRQTADNYHQYVVITTYGGHYHTGPRQAAIFTADRHRPPELEPVTALSQIE